MADLSILGILLGADASPPGATSRPSILQAARVITRSARSMHRDDGSARWGKFLRRSLRAPILTASHLLFLEGLARSHELEPPKLWMIDKLFGPFVVNGLAIEERFALARAHYNSGAAPPSAGAEQDLER